MVVAPEDNVQDMQDMQNMQNSKYAKYLSLVGGGVVVAAAVAVALDEGPGAEVAETGAGGGEVLARPVRPRVRVLTHANKVLF